ncbi:MAG: alpha/beta hydrolase [Candidatus Accumulibacter sp.]|nr:alpha/beta hydrolase [Accumulibacter sp.]
MRYKKSRTEKIDIRGLRYSVRHWGPEDAPMVFFLQGWMDCSPTFQFVVDALREEWHVIAPDWRGFGESEWLNRSYWFPDYYADFDRLLARYSPNGPARLVGHSMGANIAASYAGVRPRRVSQVVMLDSLGLKPAVDDDSPKLFDRWIDAIENGVTAHFHPNREALVARLMKANPRLSEARAAFLSRNVSRTNDDGSVMMACDPWHRVPSPLVYHVDDTLDCWRRVEAPVLLLIAEHGYIVQRFGSDPREFERRRSSLPDLRTVCIPDAGHNAQHDQPERVAAAIEAFLSRD